MKRLAIVAIGMLTTVGVWAQGTINFANGAAGVDAPVFNVDTTTRLAGSGFRADFAFAAGTVVDPNALSNVQGASVPFGTGATVGYFFGGQQALAGQATGSTVTIQVRAWDLSSGASWDTALIRGESQLVTVVLGGGPLPAANLVGLQSFSLSVIPEPSTIALGLVGFAALLFRFRRK